LHICFAGPWSPSSPGQRNDWEEGSTALGHHLIDFWTNICLCQSLIIEKNPEGPDTLPHVYQVCARRSCLALPVGSLSLHMSSNRASSPSRRIRAHWLMGSCCASVQ